MGSLSRPTVRLVDEGVDVRYGSPAELAAEVAKLREPWIADEGPLAADFRQYPGGVPDRPLHPRGLAFDDRTTITWDEDTVQVIQPAEPEDAVIARRSEVLIRERFSGPASLHRIDYLRHGVLLASRYSSDPGLKPRATRGRPSGTKTPAADPTGRKAPPRPGGTTASSSGFQPCAFGSGDAALEGDHSDA